MALQAQLVGVLHIVGLLVGLTVQIHHVVLNLQSLSGQSHTALHVVLTAIGRTGINLTKLLWMVLDDGLADLVNLTVQLKSLLG